MTPSIPPAWPLLITGVAFAIFGGVFSVAPIASLQNLGLVLLAFGAFCIVTSLMAAAMGA